MAALSAEAREAREQAGRLRVEARELKFSLRASAAHSREQLREAETALSRVRARRSDPLPSPWSLLSWTYSDEEVDRTLVPLP
jgi:DNA anti-recombination protein RmuC